LRLVFVIIGAAIAVHRVIGPGCFESAYVECLAYGFRKRGIGALTLAEGIKRVVNNFPEGGTTYVPYERSRQTGTDSHAVEE